jgi:hypothetical protein
MNKSQILPHSTAAAAGDTILPLHVYLVAGAVGKFSMLKKEKFS